MEKSDLNCGSKIKISDFYNIVHEVRIKRVGKIYFYTTNPNNEKGELQFRIQDGTFFGKIWQKYKLVIV